MTELSFLIQLLLTEELPLKIKKEVAERIKDVETNLCNNHSVSPVLPIVRASPGMQAPSTQKILDQMAVTPLPMETVQPASIAAAQALQARQEAINSAGKIQGTRARKF